MSDRGSINHVAERGAQAIDRLMQEQFDFSLNFQEMSDLRDAIYHICNSSLVAEKGNKDPDND